MKICLIVLLIWSAISDIRSRLVPRKSWLMLSFSGVIHSLTLTMPWQGILVAALKSLILPCVLLIVSLTLALANRSFGIGMGDIKILAGLAFWFDWKTILLIFWLTLTIAAIYMITLLIFNLIIKSSLTATHAPLAPHLLIAVILVSYKINVTELFNLLSC